MHTERNAEKIRKVWETLSPNERKIMPFLQEALEKKKTLSIEKISENSGLDSVSIMRALEFLQNKGIVNLSFSKEKIVDLDVNGILYRKTGLPERRLLNLLSEKRVLQLNEAQKLSNLSEDEFKASLGVLKRKALIEIKNGKIMFNANKEEIAKKTLEEIFLENLPLNYDSLTPEQKYAFESLKKRKDIIQLEEKTRVNIILTPFGTEFVNFIKETPLKDENLIEKITPNIIKNEKLWRGKKFRRYDVASPVPEVSGGKRHFVNQAIDYGRKIWTEMGFKEMSGSFIQSSFWNFDALFTAQDHPVREMHDTFFLSVPYESLPKEQMPDKKTMSAVKDSHEKGVIPGSKEKSKGWGYKWSKEEAKRPVLRTHTTCLSAQTLAKLKEKDTPAKFFAIGYNFRNETVDWNHGFELLQTEGIVVDENANFRHLLGYLREFAKKMGFDKIRFRPAYFPYTEPSVEGDVWNEEKQEWVELIAAGIFRPEVTAPLLGKPVTVLAWGPGFSRMLMAMFGIKDIRELNKNDLNQLRKLKFLVK